MNSPALKKAKNFKIDRKGDSHSFLECTSIIHIDYLPSKQPINGDYCVVLDCFNILKKKHLHLAKKKVLFHQDNARVHMCPASTNSTNSATNCSPSNIFVRFSPLQLFPVSKSEEMVRRKEIHHQRAAHRRNKGLF